MKKISFLLLFSNVLFIGFSQVVTTDPALPVHNQPVTVTFHSEQGNKGLMDYSGTDVYAHTGVITDQSTSTTDWKYVKAEWNTNLEECRMAKISANEYQLLITPDIRVFYGVPDGEKILKLAFVFRNANASATGREAGNADIFADVYEEGLNVSFIKPSDRFSLAGDETEIPVEISATGSDSLFLILDGVTLYKSSDLLLDTLLQIPGDHQKHSLIAMAGDGTSYVSDTTWFLVPDTTAMIPLPEGSHDGITYPANDSVVFVLFAPQKSTVFLLGDFNDWLPDSIYQMKRDGDRFWLGIGGLTPGKEYACQYLVDSEIRIADPYSEKILDPDHDKFIPADVYPDLVSYPSSKTHDIAGVVKPGKIPFTWNEGEYVPPNPQDLIIYELLIRDFVVSHDIKDVEDRLDYLMMLGVNAVELMPFSEFEGNSSWGYNPSFYFAPDKYYGRDSDIKGFIQACHDRGIAVIMDLVLNHAYGQNPMVRLYFNSVSGKPGPDNPWFNVDSPNPVYSWGYDFNHESLATRYFVDRVVEYWLTEYKVDGFRFDFTKGFTNTPGDGSGHDSSRIAILKRIQDKIKSVNPGAIMICEHFAANSEEMELSDYGILIWGNINYNYNEATMGYVENSDLARISYKSRGWDQPNLVGYMESHDEERLMFKNLTYGKESGSYSTRDLATALEREELAGAFFFTVPGPKMIWQFGELGYDVPIEFNGRVGEKPVKWEYYDNPDRKKLYLTWAKMLDIRKKYPVFRTSDYTMTAGNNVAAKKLVLRHDEGDAIVVGNFDVTGTNVQPGFTQTGWWYELFSGDSLDVTDISVIITLNPGEYRLYTQSKMESLISGTGNFIKNNFTIYPNPATDRIYFDVEGISVNQASVFDLSGNLVISKGNREKVNWLDVGELKPGMYILRLSTKDQVLIRKFIKR